jgi:hypothetical protein
MSDFEKPQSENPDTGWERRLLEQLALETLKEQKARRRWNIFSVRFSCRCAGSDIQVSEYFLRNNASAGPAYCIGRSERLYRGR